MQTDGPQPAPVLQVAGLVDAVGVDIDEANQVIAGGSAHFRLQLDAAAFDLARDLRVAVAAGERVNGLHVIPEDIEAIYVHDQPAVDEGALFAQSITPEMLGAERLGRLHESQCRELGRAECDRRRLIHPAVAEAARGFAENHHLIGDPIRQHTVRIDAFGTLLTTSHVRIAGRDRTGYSGEEQAEVVPLPVDSFIPERDVSLTPRPQRLV